MQLKLLEDPRAWRTFTLTTLPAPAVLGCVLWWRRVLPGPWLAAWLALLGGVAILCVLRPAWFRGWYRGGMTAGYHLSRGLGWLALTLVFFLGVLPLGLLLRLVGHDPLQLRRSPHAPSYWRSPRSEQDLRRMF